MLTDHTNVTVERITWVGQGRPEKVCWVLNLPLDKGHFITDHPDDGNTGNGGNIYWEAV